MKIKPLGKRLVLKTIKKEEKTSSGIILTDKEVEKPVFAQVVEISKDIDDIKIDDKVIYTKYKGTTVKDEDDEYIVVDYEDVLAIIEE